MLSNPGPGRLIVIEGLDGAGSTTQVRLLRARLAPGRSVHVTHEPSDGPAGLQIRMVLEHRVQMDEEALAALFAADRMDHLYSRSGEGGVIAHLERGDVVLSDRYYLSSFAYQGMSLDWEWIGQMHEPAVRPDVTLFVDVPVEECLERIARGRGSHWDRYENQRALTQARASYLRAIDRLCAAGDRIEVVEGSASPAQVHEAIWQAVAPLFGDG